jgi:hypothetical protein
MIIRDRNPAASVESKSSPPPMFGGGHKFSTDSDELRP